MAELINAKCPNCGAVLEFPADVDRAFCKHCGGKVIIARDEIHHHYGSSVAIACPECEGRGNWECVEGPKAKALIKENKKNTRFEAIPCDHKGNCIVKYSINDGIINENWARSVYNVCKNGTCGFCEGTGKSGNIFKKTCFYCKGTGKCIFCKGTGKCSFCNGTGKIKCEACDGSGFKVFEGEKNFT